MPEGWLQGESRPDNVKAKAFVRGLTLSVSVPAFVLFSTALGFGALARDGGFSIAQTVFVAATMNALPNQVLLMDQLSRGASVAAAALAVSLTGMRLLPMTVSLVPLLRPDRHPRVLQVLAVHFIAITTWIEANRRLPAIAPDLRLLHHLGTGVAIATAMLLGTILGYWVVGGVPAIVSAALLFMTPLYFFLSLVGTSRSRMDYAAVALGGGLSPLLYLALPGFDLLATGLIAGTLAFLLRSSLRERGGT